MKRTAILCAAAAALVSACPVQAARVTVDAFKHSEPFFESNVQVDLAGEPGVTGVRAVRADGVPTVLDMVGPDLFGAWQGPFGTFAALHNATVGDWRLIVELGAGNEAVYDMAVNDFRTPFTSSSFPPAPTVLTPPDGGLAGPAPTFVWDSGGAHTGALENLFVSVLSQVDPTVGVFENSAGPGLSLDAETWTPAIVLPEGPASFLVQYETNENEDANVDDPVFNAALSGPPDPGIVWTDSSGDLFSRDLIEFTVVGDIPEPASVVLFLLGNLAVYRRLRSRRRGA